MSGTFDPDPPHGCKAFVELPCNKNVMARQEVQRDGAIVPGKADDDGVSAACLKLYTEDQSVRAIGARTV